MVNTSQNKNDVEKAVLKFLSTDELHIKTVRDLGSKQISHPAQLSNKYKEITIWEAAKDHSLIFSSQAKACPPLSVIDVVLAANREYLTRVEPVIKRFNEEAKNANTPFLFLKVKTFESLYNYLKNNLPNFYNNYVKDTTKNNSEVKAAESLPEGSQERDFLKNQMKIEVNHGKVKLLFELLDAIIELKAKNPHKDDYTILNEWAVITCESKDLKNAEGNIDLKKLRMSLGKKITNFGIATLQHLRMHFGADTFKPDQRLKEVFLFDFLGLDKIKFSSSDLSDDNVFKMMDKIKDACDNDLEFQSLPYKFRFLDSIFVNYGSMVYADQELNPK